MSYDNELYRLGRAMAEAREILLWLDSYGDLGPTRQRHIRAFLSRTDPERVAKPENQQQPEAPCACSCDYWGDTLERRGNPKCRVHREANDPVLSLLGLSRAIYRIETEQREQAAAIEKLEEYAKVSPTMRGKRNHPGDCP